MSAENRAFESLLRQLLSALCGHSSIHIVCSTGFEFDCDDVRNLEGSKRADFAFYLNGLPQVFLSHKATGFSHHGYGTLSHKPWANTSNPAANHAMRWARQFCVDQCYAGHDSGGLLEWPKSFAKGIWFHPAPELQKAMIYGWQYGSGTTGLDNVDLLAVGDPKLDPRGDGTWSLSFTEPHGLYRNGIVPPAEHDHAPIVVVKNTDKMRYWFYTTKEPLCGMKADFGYFPLRLVYDRETKAKDCIQVEYPSGKLLKISCLLRSGPALSN